MDRRFSIPYFITLAGIPVAAGLRIWSLNTAVDNLGMPVMHRSIYALIAAAGLYLLLALLCAVRSSCRETGPGALIYGRGGWICGALASGMILLGAAAEFWESLVAGPGISAPIMLLLGLLGGICAFITVLHRRRNGARYPAAEIIPVVYLLVKTMLNFKHWSTDPVIDLRHAGLLPGRRLCAGSGEAPADPVQLHGCCVLRRCGHDGRHSRPQPLRHCDLRRLSAVAAPCDLGPAGRARPGSGRFEIRGKRAGP